METLNLDHIPPIATGLDQGIQATIPAIFNVDPDEHERALDTIREFLMDEIARDPDLVIDDWLEEIDLCELDHGDGAELHQDFTIVAKLSRSVSSG